MADVPALMRQWLLLRILSARRLGVALRDLAHELGVTARTIQRDLDLLERLGFGITSDSAEFGRKIWKLTDETGLAELRFTLEEAAALYMGRQFLEPLAGTMFHIGAKTAFDKIRSTLGEPALQHLERLAAGFYHADRGWTDYSGKAALIDQLAIAVEDGVSIAIEYQSLRATESVTYYDLTPLALVYWRQALYLIVESPDKGGKRTFKVNRISGVELIPMTKRRRQPLDVDAYLADSFGIFHSESKPVTVRVRFQSQARRLLDEREWHPSQRLEIGRDGSVIATFRLAALEEFTSWILGWGPLAEVLAPDSLRRSVHARLRETVALYEPVEAVPKSRRRIDGEAPPPKAVRHPPR